MTMTRLILESPFPPQECQRRLEAATVPDTLRSHLRGGEAVLAHFFEGGFRLRLRRAYIRNSFSRLLYGLYHSSAKGSAIHVRRGLHPLVLAFTILWFSFIGLWTVLVAILIIAQRVTAERI